MCTLSWKPLANGYVLFFNRDERRSRQAALGPELKQKNGVEFLAPTDGARGGTWLLVNAHGISIGLLNNYAATSPAINVDFASRGMLPLACADCSSVRQAISRVKAMSLESFPPFHIVIASAGEAAVLSWDGVDCVDVTLAGTGAMLTSSAFQPEKTEQARRATFARLVGDMAAAGAEQLQAFHWQTSRDGAQGILMAREDACTHSISHITVDLDEQMAQFCYTPEPERATGCTNLTQSLALLTSKVH